MAENVREKTPKEKLVEQVAATMAEHIPGELMTLVFTSLLKDALNSLSSTYRADDLANVCQKAVGERIDWLLKNGPEFSKQVDQLARQKAHEAIIIAKNCVVQKERSRY